MNNSRLVKISKHLSKYLRHRPESIGIQLAPGGWVPVSELLDACQKYNFPIQLNELKEVGSRHGILAIFTVDTAAMHRDSYTFYSSENGVWLVDFVPQKYFKISDYSAVIS